MKQQLSAGQPCDRASRSLTAGFGVLLALVAAFATVTGLTPPVNAGDRGSPAQSSGVRVLSAGSVADGVTRESPRLACQPGATPPEYLSKNRTEASERQKPATLRRAAVDYPEWTRTSDCMLFPSRVGPEGNWASSEGATHHRAYRTFDGRAPPLS